MRITGTMLIALGLLTLALGGIPYQKKTHVAQIGDVKMQVKEEKQVAVPPLFSGVAILVGAALLFMNRSKPSA